MVGWLAGLLLGCLASWLVGLQHYVMTGCLLEGCVRLWCSLIGRQSLMQICWLLFFVWLDGWMAGSLVGCLSHRVLGWLIDWLVRWLVGGAIGWLLGWCLVACSMAGWLVDLLMNSLGWLAGGWLAVVAVSCALWGFVRCRVLCGASVVAVSCALSLAG